MRSLRRLALALALAACAPGPTAEDAELDLLRARNAEAQGRFDWARIYYHQDLERHPDRPESLRGEGLAWLSGYQQSLSTGSTVLARYLELRPDDIEVRQRLVHTLLLLGEWPRARELASTLGDSPLDRRLRAEVVFEADPEAAREILAPALAAAPEDAAVQALAARVCERLERLDEARAAAEAATRLSPLQHSSYYLLGRLLARQGEVERGREVLELHQQLRRLQHDGTMAPLPPAEALALLSELLPRLPAVTFEVRKRHAELQLQSGQAGEAIAALPALAAAPEATPADLLELAKWAGEAGFRSDSRRLFAAALERQPGDPGALASLAQLDLETGDLAAARQRLDAALAADPHFARYHYLRALVARAEDQSAAARRHFEQALDLAPWEWTWRVALADLLLALGETKAFHQLLAAAPEPTPGLEAYRQQHALP